MALGIPADSGVPPTTRRTVASIPWLLVIGVLLILLSLGTLGYRSFSDWQHRLVAPAGPPAEVLPARLPLPTPRPGPTPTR